MSTVPFEGVLGNNVNLRLLQHLMSTPKLEFNTTELSKITGVSWPSVEKTLAMFLEWKIVQETSRHGRMVFYSINEESNLVKAMRDFNTGLMEIMFPELFDGPFAPFAPPRVTIEDIPTTNATEGTFTGNFNLYNNYLREKKTTSSSTYSMVTCH